MFLITPIIWILGLLIFTLFIKNPKRKKRFAVIIITMLLFFSNSFIVDEVFRAWEMPAMRYDEIVEPYDVGIVLGGMMSYDSKYDRINVKQSIDRVLQAVELYHRGKIKKILLTGGSGSIIDDEFLEAKHIRDFICRLGIPEDDVLFEANSRNTRENALKTAELLSNNDSLNNSKCLLITSAFHMRRGLGCFRKVGIDVTPFVADRYAGERKFIFDHLIVPNVDALTNWTLILHEITGYIVYAVMGYI